MKKKLLFVNQSQFGYQIDYVQYCNYLKDEYDITYLCWDYKKDKIDDPDINIIYVSRDGIVIRRAIRFIQYVMKSLIQGKYSLAFISYFRGSSVISMLNINSQPLHLDIRTGSINPNTIKRSIYNIMLRFESKFFKSQSIITIGLRHKLQIRNNAQILPLGANSLNVKRISSHKLHLLYIGTLSNRRIEDTIDGFNIFLQENQMADIQYTIVGKGWHNETESLQNKINLLGLQGHIILKGYVPYHELIQFYEIANVGVSYIPLTPYYEYQPVTKTYEYLMVGMPVIATATYENKQVVNLENGVLVKDTPESFADGIAKLYKKIDTFNENAIKKSVANCEWNEIIKTMKETILS